MKGSAVSIVTVIATVIVKPGHEKVVEQALLDLVTPSRQDAGCLKYHLHRDTKQKNVFVFYENWETQERLEQHMKMPHFIAFQDKVEGLLESVDMKLMKEIS